MFDDVIRSTVGDVEDFKRAVLSTGRCTFVLTREELSIWPRSVGNVYLLGVSQVCAYIVYLLILFIIQ